MGFKLSKMDVGMTPPIEYLPGKEGEVYTLGEALALDAGAVTKCGAAARPDYVAVGPVNKQEEVPVVKVQDYMTFETTLSAAAAGLTVGGKVSLSADGLQVTSGEGAGILTALEGTAAGDAVTVRF